MEEYLIKDYDVLEDERYLPSVESIVPYFKNLDSRGCSHLSDDGSLMFIKESTKDLAKMVVYTDKSASAMVGKFTRV